MGEKSQLELGKNLGTSQVLAGGSVDVTFVGDCFTPSLVFRLRWPSAIAAVVIGLVCVSAGMFPGTCLAASMSTKGFGHYRRNTARPSWQGVPVVPMYVRCLTPMLDRVIP